MADFLDATVNVPGHVVLRSFPAEVVVLDLETGRYHGLNPTAGRMLEVLQELHTVRPAVEQIAREFAQPLDRIAADMRTLCEDLAERRLIVIDGAGGG